eukprot:TRINITY_DN3017_c0_g3_i1.p1 TRINITY_DN3017_c0_g3~~TRINITY_DN3017_c0_g3_i1.p1  ORF type:complete len:158 (-),score=32.04 TRINITY_DN3017_c0_g3_i1:662-1081(-)
MDAGGFFRGASADQDARFSNREKKLLNSTAFPQDFEKKVDIKKVKVETIKPWITKRVTDLLGLEDDVLINYIFSMLEEQPLCPKSMQINLTGFLETDAPTFMKELWNLLLSAQSNAEGIPQEFLDQKREELKHKKVYWP